MAGTRHRRRRATVRRVGVVDRLALPLSSRVNWRPGSEETRGWKATDRPLTASRLPDWLSRSSVNAVATSPTTHVAWPPCQQTPALPVYLHCRRYSQFRILVGSMSTVNIHGVRKN